MYSRAALAAVPLLVMPLGFSALVVFQVAADPAVQVALLGVAFACAVTAMTCWYLLALAWMITAR
jgi:NhaP-type Na+/H+ and K+/H+ antiporter